MKSYYCLLAIICSSLMMLDLSAANVQLEDYNSMKTIPQHITIIKAWRHGLTDSNKESLLIGGGPDDPNGKTALNEEGRRQAKQLGDIIHNHGKLDIVYSSDSERALDTAKEVLTIFEKNGKSFELRTSMQLREIMHGKFELTNGKVRTAAGINRIQEFLERDEQQKTAEEELNDKFRFWKIHPQVSNDEIVPGLIVDVKEYIRRQETRPETNYQLWLRLQHEFTKIAKAHPGSVVGVSMHGAGIATLLAGLNENFEGLYLPPHYNSKDIIIRDQLIMPEAATVENCGIFYFIYDSREGGKLEVLTNVAYCVSQ